MSDPIIRYPVNALISYHYYKRNDIAEIKDWGYRLIGDSGAFSALSLGKPIELEEFAEWGLKWRDQLFWIASLDVIGDADASFNNFNILRNDFKLDVVPTVHFGDEPQVLDKYVDAGVDFIGLGGMVSKAGKSTALLKWCLSMFRYAKKNHPDLKFHGWGVTHPELILNLPFYSVDSSGFGSPWRYARIRLFNPDTRKFQSFALNGKDAHGFRDILNKHYNGVTPEEISTSTPANKRILVLLAIRNAQLLEDFLRDRYAIPAPSYGINHNLSFETAAGTNAHFANTDTQLFKLASAPDGTNIAFVDTNYQRYEWAKQPNGLNIHAVVDYSDYKIAQRNGDSNE